MAESKQDAHKRSKSMSELGASLLGGVIDSQIDLEPVAKRLRKALDHASPAWLYTNVLPHISFQTESAFDDWIARRKARSMPKESKKAHTFVALLMGQCANMRLTPEDDKHLFVHSGGMLPSVQTVMKAAAPELRILHIEDCPNFWSSVMTNVLVSEAHSLAVLVLRGTQAVDLSSVLKLLNKVSNSVRIVQVSCAVHQWTRDQVKALRNISWKLPVCLHLCMDDGERITLRIPDAHVCDLLPLPGAPTTEWRTKLTWSTGKDERTLFGHVLAYGKSPFALAVKKELAGNYPDQWPSHCVIRAHMHIVSPTHVHLDELYSRPTVSLGEALFSVATLPEQDVFRGLPPSLVRAMLRELAARKWIDMDKAVVTLEVGPSLTGDPEALDEYYTKTFGFVERTHDFTEACIKHFFGVDKEAAVTTIMARSNIRPFPDNIPIQNVVELDWPDTFWDEKKAKSSAQELDAGVVAIKRIYSERIPSKFVQQWLLDHRITSQDNRHQIVLAALLIELDTLNPHVAQDMILSDAFVSAKLAQSLNDYLDELVHRYVWRVLSRQR
jgi:hypothetical protein